MPGLGRPGIEPGLGRGPPGPAGPAGRGGIPPGAAGRGAPGRGAATLPPVPNGLLAMRGRGGAGAGAGSAIGASTTGGTTASTGSGRRAGPGTAATGATGASGSKTDSMTGSASAISGAAFLAGAFFAGAFLAGAAPASDGAGGGNASVALRTAGASIVEEGVLTYSPLAFSQSTRSLLLMPSSFASADTRVLPGT